MLLRKFILREVWHLSYGLSPVPRSLRVTPSTIQRPRPTEPQPCSTEWVPDLLNHQSYFLPARPKSWLRILWSKTPKHAHFYPHKREHNLNKIEQGWRTCLPWCTKIFYWAEPPSGRTEYVCVCVCVFFQFSRSVLFDSLWPHGRQHARLPCPSPTPGVYLDSCPLSRWCHPTISSSVVPFSSRLQSFPASGAFPVSQFFATGGQSIGVFKFSFNFSALVAQMVKNPPTMWETWVWSLGWEDPLKEGIATHSRILTWRIPRREEPGGLQSVGSQRVGHDWATNTKNNPT